jgi:hypothetical protein
MRLPCISRAPAFVAHAKVAGVITEGSPLVRNSERFTQVVTLSDVAVYHAPIGAAEELVRKIDESLAHGSTAVATPGLAPGL